MDLLKTRHVVYHAPTAEEHNVVYAVDVVNINAFFSCRFLISTKARADLKTDHTTRYIHSVINSPEFRQFWEERGVTLPFPGNDGPLSVVRVDKAYKQVYRFNVSVHNLPDANIPLWAEAYNKEHASVLLDGILTNIGIVPAVCEAVLVE